MDILKKIFSQEKVRVTGALQKTGITIEEMEFVVSRKQSKR